MLKILFPIKFMLPSKDFLFSKTSWRRLNRNNLSSSKTSSRHIQDVFMTCLQGVFLKRPQNVFARHLFQDVFKKTSCFFVLKTFWRYHWRYLQDVFKTSSVRLHQNECLLGELSLQVHLHYENIRQKGIACKKIPL